MGSQQRVISEEGGHRDARLRPRELAPSASVYLEQDFLMNLLEPVLDYTLKTEVVVKALQRFRENHGIPK